VRPDGRMSHGGPNGKINHEAIRRPVVDDDDSA